MKTISIDFWNTLVDARTGGKERHQARIDKIKEIAARYNQSITPEQVEDAKKKASEEFDLEWLGHQRTMLTHELVDRIVNHLGIPAKKNEKEELTFVFQHSLLKGAPDLAAGVLEVIPRLAAKYPLAIISDTMFSPGSVLRSYLMTKGLLDYFSHFVFSDEVGYSKPDKRAFLQVLEKNNALAEHSFHIGDIQDTDIKGAQSVGMKAILYTGISNKFEEGTTADFVASNWNIVAHYTL
ncbi:HAD family hydrolase [bacterium]|nr:MAG: HAD family hydrolase [bacterium]